MRKDTPKKVSPEQKVPVLRSGTGDGVDVSRCLDTRDVRKNTTPGRRKERLDPFSGSGMGHFKGISNSEFRRDERGLLDFKRHDCRGVKDRDRNGRNPRVWDDPEGGSRTLRGLRGNHG